MKKLNNILLVDDNLATNYFNQITIQKMDVCKKVHVVNDGEEALKFITNTGKYEDNSPIYPIPELILLDVKMHGMNAFDFLEAFHNLKSEQKGNSIIVMLSSSYQEEEKKRAKSFERVKDLTLKPLTKENIAALFERYF